MTNPEYEAITPEKARWYNLEIAVGERLVLLGPSGIGKSTLLRLLLGTLKPESGRILLNGVTEFLAAASEEPPPSPPMEAGA